MRKILIAAAAALASTALAVPAAQASTTHRTPQPTVTSTYSCSNAVQQVWTGSGDIWGKSCDFAFTVIGPASSVKVTITSPRRELAYLNYQIQELPAGQPDSAMGSDWAIVRIPTVMAGYSGNETFGSPNGANSSVAPGEEMLGWVVATVPANERLPQMTIQASR